MYFKISKAGIYVTGYNTAHSLEELGLKIAKELEISQQDFYLTHNGKIISSELPISSEIPIHVVARVRGGKGGFGSMLRAIGAQIEKTTNRYACRDLSGRRLRDINEEQRLKKWFAKQGEREQEKIEAKKRKLEKLQKISDGPPLPLLDDKDYNKQRAEMADSVFDAVDKEFEAAKASKSETATSNSSDNSNSGSGDDEKPTTSSSKPTSETTKSSSNEPPPKKIKKLMMDEDFSDVDTSSDEDEVPSKAIKLSV